MDKKVAKKIVGQLLEFSMPFNKLTLLSFDLPTEKDSRAMRRKLGAIAVSIDKIMRPIVREFPDLDPDR